MLRTRNNKGINAKLIWILFLKSICVKPTLKPKSVLSNKARSISRLLAMEEGSLSLLIIGLFIAALSALMIVTDVAVVANAKRTFSIYQDMV